ncbi:MAG: hypothetical protein J6B01_04945 [Ruminococcus sp.]|nr:hypothetical protein [Ruminococcus sp.]MBO5319138.1 hypothetical protein [Ruminococcus sp.]
MFRLICVAGPFGDCTSRYEVRLDKQYTVREFIDAVLTNKPNEWGSIGIEKSGTIFGDPRCHYKRGVLLNNLPDEYLNKNVISARSHGGWSNMDYNLKVDV